MTELSVSVIIVSRGRPQSLCRCLTAVSQLLYKTFEIVVVVDTAGFDAVTKLSFSDRIKISKFDDVNISTARNHGLTLAAGEIVAFIDDDAVPEPAWLLHLVQPFKNPMVSAAGGFVRGRNGISYQWQGQEIDEFGYSKDITITTEQPTIVSAGPGKAIKTQGTNCAFRRSTLAEIGGFDPAFRYYLDEADVNFRLAERGNATAIVPRAEVHHCYEASETRLQNRVPKSLFEIGASQAIYLRKHASVERFDEVLKGFCEAQRATLIRHMIAGNCEPGDVGVVMSTLNDGILEGLSRSIVPLPVIAQSDLPFCVFRQNDDARDHRIICGYRIHARRLRRQAEETVRRGYNVSLYLFSRTARFHRLSYRNGYWEQAGGIFGKSVRSEPVFQFTRLKQRLKKETQRVLLRRDPLDTAERIS